MPEDHKLYLIRSAIIDLELHEVNERIKYKGKHLREPHEWSLYLSGGVTASKLPDDDFFTAEYVCAIWFVDADNFTDDEREAVKNG